MIGQVVRWGRVSSMMAEYDWSPGVSVKQGQVVGFASTSSLCLLNSCCGKHVCCLAATCLLLSPHSPPISFVPFLSLEYPPFSSPTLSLLSLSLPLFFLPSSRSLSLSPLCSSLYGETGHQCVTDLGLAKVKSPIAAVQ